MFKKSSQLAVASLAGLGMLAGAVRDLHAAIVIEEVYGGGGTAATTGSYNQDFIELYNNGALPVNLTGDVVAYSSSTATTFSLSSSTVSVLIGGQQVTTIAAGGYYLISGQASSTYGGAALPVTPDATSVLSLSATTGAVGLFASSTISPATAPNAIDEIGYGTAKQYETTDVAALSVTTAAYRTVLGVDTNNNAADFTVGATPAPQSTGLTSVPEPTSLGLVGVASALLLRRRKVTSK